MAIAGFVIGLGAGRAQSVYATPYTTHTLAGVPPVGRGLAVDGAPFGFPTAVAVDRFGNIYVADGFSNDATRSHVIRKVSPTGVTTLLAGSAGLPGSVDGFGTNARFNEPSGIAVDPRGNVYVTEFQSNTLRTITPDGNVTTLAGQAGSSGSADGAGSAARFNGPLGVAVDGAGNVFVSDANNSTIRKVTPEGIVTTFAGAAGNYGNRDGLGSAAQFRRPYGIAVDNSGAVYVSDHIYGAIRKISPAGLVTTLAGGSGFPGATDGVGTAARFTSPFGIAVDGVGNVYVADRGNHLIRKITPAGAVTTLAGLVRIPGSSDGIGSSARFNAPYGVAADGAGNIYVADTFNTTIRRINSDGAVTTFAGIVASNGSVDGIGRVVRFNEPYGIAVDGAGNVYVADTHNHTLRKISATGVVTTLAGRARDPGSADGIGSNAQFSVPRGVAVDRSGNLYIADTGNSIIRKLAPTGAVTTIAGVAGLNPLSVAVDSAGNLYITDTFVSAAARMASSTIRRITPDGTVTTIAGTPLQTGSADGVGSEARFGYAAGIAVDVSGDIYVADMGNHTIRKITRVGEVTTFAGSAGRAGSADGFGSEARFNGPYGVAFDPSGNLIVAETNSSVIRTITPAGLVTTIAGRPQSAGSTDGVGSVARFSSPRGVAVDQSGAVYVVDTFNNTIRKLMPHTAPVVAGRLINLSTRGPVQAGGSLTAGFVMKGAGAKQLMIRGIGPTLDTFGVGNPLGDPKLEISATDSPDVLSNNDWAGLPSIENAAARVGAFALPADSKDAALHGAFVVNPGGHTARVTAADAANSGVALAEIYDADPTTAEASLINLSTLGFAGSGENALVMGFVLSGPTPKRVLIRAVGPGLGAFAVTELLADPRLDVFQPGQAVALASNDNWGGTLELKAAFAQAGAFPLAENTSDAALAATLMPGAYTVIASGVGGTTGNVLLEIYDLDP